jgi:surface antigen bspA-like
MKKAFAIVIIVTLFAVPAIAQVLMHQDGLTYTLYNLGGTPYADVSGQSLMESTTVTIPSTITNEGIEYTVTEIGANAFAYCDFLTSIDIPTSVTTIGHGAFYNCDALFSIELPNSITAIGDRAFENCDALSSISIPHSVTSIGQSAFSFCHSLTNAELPNSLNAIDDYTFWDCTSLTNIKIPNSVKTIGSMAFAQCRALSTIDIPSSVTDIGSSAFFGCSALTTVALPNSVKTIGEAAFNQCSSLTAVDIPCSITDIGSGAFGACSQLAEINYNTHDPILLPIKDIFSDDTYLWGTLNVPVGTIDIFRNSAPWSYFEIIKECDFSGIEEAATDLDPNTPLAVYNLNGVKVADSTVNLPAGTYIVSQGTISKKITIK